MNTFEFVLQQAINALALGSLYAVVAVGLSIVFSVLRMTNFAHGEMLTVGAFATLGGAALGWPFAASVALAIGAAAATGVLLERVAYRPLRGAPDVALLLTSFAASYLLQNLGVLLFTGSPRAFPVPEWFDGSVEFADGAVVVPHGTLATVALTGAAFAGFGGFVTRSTPGLGLRAIAEDLTAARLVGLPVDRLIVLAFAIAAGFAGLGGVLWAAQTGVTSPAMGFQPLLKAFVAAIVGGLGSVPAALAGGYLLGALEVGITASLDSGLAAWRDAIVFALLIAFLLYRPHGLFRRVADVKL
jgi:branched-chain amino acid transport system permease protein